ncbi:glycosyltransferase family 87 protein [Fluviispira sanaruensis]|uniref:glycosyltransferase family 87 protein n=1 Tax=Fluviispira sanaruensis TaxID=2493639 RepID=UPI003CCC80EC
MGWSIDPNIFGHYFEQTKDPNPYHAYFGVTSGIYKYAPFSLLLFLIFSIFPWNILLFLYPLLNMLAFYAFFKILKTLIIENFYSNNLIDLKKLNIAFILCFILQSHNIYREIFMGNINIFLMLSCVFFLKLFLNNKFLLSSIILSLIILIKPHFVFIIPLLFIFRYFNLIFYTGVVSFLIFFSVYPIFGIEKSIALISSWLNTINVHNNFSWYLENPLNFQYIIWKILKIFLFNLNTRQLTAYTYSVIIMSHLIIFTYILLKRKQFNNFLFMKVYFVILAIIPFVFLVDTNQLIYTIPLIVILIYNYMLNAKSPNKILSHISIWLFALLFIFTIMTQQIPRDWLPLNFFVGISYITLFVYSYSIKHILNILHRLTSNS